MKSTKFHIRIEFYNKGELKVLTTKIECLNFFSDIERLELYICKEKLIYELKKFVICYSIDYQSQ